MYRMYISFYESNIFQSILYNLFIRHIFSVILIHCMFLFYQHLNLQPIHFIFLLSKLLVCTVAEYCQIKNLLKKLNRDLRYILYRDLDILHRDLDILHRDLDILHRDLDILHRDLDILHRDLDILQHLLHALNCAATDVSMTFNTKKTVCMVFAPSNRNKIIANKFPALTLAGTELLYVEQFKYLGHIIDNKLSDSSDIIREIKCMFTRTNILLRRFKHCSVRVKIILFKTYCMCIVEKLHRTSYEQNGVMLLPVSEDLFWLP